MRSLGLSIALLLLAAAPLQADDVPFANPPSVRVGGLSAANVVDLGDIMGQTQIRHIKLWYAGESGDWSLVGYEISRIGDSLGRAAALYRGIPIELVTGALGPVAEMQKAAATKNETAFRSGYAHLTKACNACHEGGGVGFIRIQTPTSLPFTDESFVK